MTDHIETTYKNQIVIEAPKVLGSADPSAYTEMIAENWD